MNCNQCGKSNRKEAKFCKYCGSALLVDDFSEDFCGKDCILPLVHEYVDSIVAAKELLSGGNRVNLNAVVLGDPGTGKHFVSRFLCDRVRQAKVVTGAVKEIDAADWSDFENKFDENLASISDGILLVTGVQKLLPAAQSLDVNRLDKLFARMRTGGEIPIVILCGSLNEMSIFLSNNTDVASLFAFRFDLPSFEVSDITEMTVRLLREKWNKDVDAVAREKLGAHVTWLCRQSEQGALNGRMSEILAEKLAIRIGKRHGQTLDVSDIDDDQIFRIKSEADILAELDRYIGLDSVKQEIKAIVRNVNKKKAAGAKDHLIRDHYVFTGNPGTGKTTFARKFGEVLHAIGALPKGQFIEIAGKDLIADVVGGTERNVEEAVTKAMGGILFIDEAYGLNDSSFGKAGIDKLLPIVENRKGEFVCILAGYTKQMDDFMRVNPGLKSRFNVVIDFPDYQAKELENLFRLMISKEIDGIQYTLDESAEKQLGNIFKKMYLRRGEDFGNARDVRNLLDNAIKHQSLRRDAVGNELSYQDLAGEEETRTLSVEDVLKELDQFIGMASVKQAVRELARDMDMEQRKIRAGITNPTLTKINIILTGNPGTGKTSVARIFGKLFKAIGLIPDDRVVEKNPKDVIGQYVNTSDKIMDDAVKEAMGGVLFLDEAYDIDPVGPFGRSNAEGKKAIQALMTRMENDAGKFVVVCAGYKDKMDEFLGSNVGLKRRFTHYIHIDDYTPDELLQIYEKMLAGLGGYHLQDDAARNKALAMFTEMVANKDAMFGNAGEARNKADATRRRLNNRIYGIGYDNLPVEAYTAVTADDIPYTPKTADDA